MVSMEWDSSDRCWVSTAENERSFLASLPRDEWSVLGRHVYKPEVVLYWVMRKCYGKAEFRTVYVRE